MARIVVRDLAQLEPGFLSGRFVDVVRAAAFDSKIGGAASPTTCLRGRMQAEGTAA